MDTASALVEPGVHLPVYESITGNLLRQFEHASSISSASTDDEGEMYALFAAMIPAEGVPDGSIMIIPLSPPSEEDTLDFTFLAGRKSMFVKIHEVPRESNTCGHIASYSVGTVDMPYPVGTLIRFATTTNFVVAQPRLVASIMGALGAEVDTMVAGQRQMEGGGESAEDTGEKPKGTYLQDLDDRRHFSRNKTDVAKRELELKFIFRAMDDGKMDYCTTTDLVLQTESYRSMICEQGDTIPRDRHKAFMSCGIISRVGSLLIFFKKEKLRPF
jgi:hypothetical protein